MVLAIAQLFPSREPNLREASVADRPRTYVRILYDIHLLAIFQNAVLRESQRGGFWRTASWCQLRTSRSRPIAIAIAENQAIVRSSRWIVVCNVSMYFRSISTDVIRRHRWIYRARDRVVEKKTRASQARPSSSFWQLRSRLSSIDSSNRDASLVDYSVITTPGDSKSCLDSQNTPNVYFIWFVRS